MVTVKELVMLADPEGHRKRDIWRWGDRLIRASPVDPRLVDFFQTTSASIGDLQGRTEMAAHNLFRRGEITPDELERLTEEEIPDAFEGIYSASLEEFKKKYKVVK
jgi:hypothetical protein